MTAGVSFNEWNCEGAIRNILNYQSNDGAIAGSTGLTFLGMTTLAGQSMAYVNELEHLNCGVPRA